MMANPGVLRRRQWQDFGSLNPEERLGWALAAARALWARMGPDARRRVDQLRNGWKKKKR